MAKQKTREVRVTPKQLQTYGEKMGRYNAFKQLADAAARDVATFVRVIAEGANVPEEYRGLEIDEKGKKMIFSVPNQPQGPQLMPTE